MPKTETSSDQASLIPNNVEIANGAGNPAKSPKPIQLRSAHDFELLRRSLTNEAEAVEKLATKNRESGYVREAANIAADAAVIRDVVLPQLTAQSELPLVSAEALEQQIANALKLPIYQMFDGLDDPKAKLTTAIIQGRRDKLVQTLASKITAFVQELAEAAHSAGYQARALTSEVLAVKALPALAGKSGSRAD